MLSSLTAFAKGRSRGDRSPFSSPYTALLSSSVATKRDSLDERRRPAADFDRDGSPSPTRKLLGEGQEREDPEEEDDEAGYEEDGEGDNDENSDGEITPLLPIFSAAHLGKPDP